MRPHGGGELTCSVQNWSTKPFCRSVLFIICPDSRCPSDGHKSAIFFFLKKSVSIGWIWIPNTQYKFGSESACWYCKAHFTQTTCMQIQIRIVWCPELSGYQTMKKPRKNNNRYRWCVCTTLNNRYMNHSANNYLKLYHYGVFWFRCLIQINDIVFNNLFQNDYIELSLSKTIFWKP